MTTQALASRPAVSPVVAAKRDVQSFLQSDKVKQQMALALPKHITPDRMVRVALTAILRNPSLMQCSQESLLNSLMRCSQVGLEPDGRNAHLIPYGNKCEAIFDWKGLVNLARRNGVGCTAKLVHENDTFIVKEDDGTGKTSVTHVVDYKKPRGEMYAVYSRAKTGDDVDYEIMTKDEIEYVRNTFSRAKDADAWSKSWGEMAKKTVIRRHSKRWPLDAEIAAAFEDEPETPAVTVRPIFAAPKQLFEAPTAALPATETASTAPPNDDDGDLAPQTQPPEPAQPEKQPGASESERQVKTDSAQAPAAASPPQEQPKSNPPSNLPKAIKGLLNLSRHTEPELMAHLAATGKLDDSVGTLRDADVVARPVLQWCHDNWQQVDKELKSQKAKQ